MFFPYPISPTSWGQLKNWGGGGQRIGKTNSFNMVHVLHFVWGWVLRAYLFGSSDPYYCLPILFEDQSFSYQKSKFQNIQNAPLCLLDRASTSSMMMDYLWMQVITTWSQWICVTISQKCMRQGKEDPTIGFSILDSNFSLCLAKTNWLANTYLSLWTPQPTRDHSNCFVGDRGGNNMYPRPSDLVGIQNVFVSSSYNKAWMNSSCVWEGVCFKKWVCKLADRPSLSPLY